MFHLKNLCFTLYVTHLLSWTSRQIIKHFHSDPAHTHNLAGGVRKDMYSLDLLISHTGLHYMPAHQQMGNCAHWVFQVGEETVDTAGYTEPVFGGSKG